MAFRLSVQNFRSHINYSVELSDSSTVITGVNGSGKTSLIEAIYLAYTGKSWRSNFEDIKHYQTNRIIDWWRIDLVDTNLAERRIVKYHNGIKEFIINNQAYKRLPKAARRPVMLFEPNDMQLLYGSPARRRQFIDRFIAQLEPSYQTELNKFERTLKQRNRLLKETNYSASEMMIWNIQFSSLSNKISRYRRQYLLNISKILSNKYFEIAGSHASIKLQYLPGGPVGADNILTALEASLECLTPLGAQKDDYRFVFNKKDARAAASRGENRTILLAMLAVMADIARDSYDDKVIILLDDIDSELDQLHRTNLYQISSFQKNTIATTIDYQGNNLPNIRLG